MTLAAIVAALTAPARLARGAEDDAGAPVASLRQEWVGVEVTPASIALASPGDWIGHFTGGGDLLLGGLEVGFGRG
jgi:hypothetical protein